MPNKNIINVLAFLAVFSILASGCQATKPVEKPEENAIDTGILIVESVPGSAHVYIDGEFKGETPLKLYNIPVGAYTVVIKKEGYADFEGIATVKVGRAEEIDAVLAELATKPAEDEKPVEKAEEITINASIPKLNKINLSSFAMYYDFEAMQFSEIRTDKSDLFSRKYDTYVHFTALTPAKVNLLNKPISDVQKEDCIFSDDAVAIIYSGQSLCVKTAEGSVVAIGGSWKESPAELEWALLS